MGSQSRIRHFALRVPPSLYEAATEFSKSEGVSLNYFIGLALTEKIDRLRTMKDNRHMVAPFDAPVSPESGEQSRPVKTITH